MRIKTQWELWQEIDQEDDFPQDHWEDKWIKVEEEILYLENLVDNMVDELDVRQHIKKLRGEK